MDTRMIEVGIGLALVFALASLAVTTLHEIWTSLPFNRSRSDTLMLAVCSLLGDNHVTYGSWRRRIMGLAGSQRPSSFTLELLAHPLLQSQVLGTAKKGETPSYLQAETFVSALVADLSQRFGKGPRPTTPQLWLNQMRAGLSAAAATNGQHGAMPQPDFVKSLEALAQGCERSWPTYEQRLCAWYDGVMERAGGWYRRDTQLRLMALGTLVAVAVNVNPIVIAPRLWSDGPLRAAMVAAGQEASKAYAAAASAPQAAASAALAAISPATTTAAATPAAAKAARAEGPALRSAQSLEVNHALKIYRDALYSQAQAWRAHPPTGVAQQFLVSLEGLEQLEEMIKLRRQALDHPGYPTDVFASSIILEARLRDMRTQMTPGEPTAAVARAHPAAVAMLERLQTALVLERNAFIPQHAGQTRPPGAGECHEVADGKARQLCQQLGGLQSLKQAGLPIGWYWTNWPECDSECVARHRPRSGQVVAGHDAYAAMLQTKPDTGAQALQSSYDAMRRQINEPHVAVPTPTPAQTAGSAASGALSVRSRGPGLLSDPDTWKGLWWAVPGWLLTGLATMLGAPFWFDMLGKLVKLRGSGAKAPDAPGGGGAGGGAGGPGGDAGGSGARTTLTTPPQAGGPGGLGAAPAPTPSGNGSPGAALGAVSAAEAALGSGQIVRLQRALGLTGDQQASGQFDLATRDAIEAWQRARGEDASGTLSAVQLDSLLPPAAAPRAAPSAEAGAPRTATPLRADGSITVLNEDSVRSLYGNITTRPVTGGGLAVDVTSTEPPSPYRMVLFEHPVLAPHLPHGCQVHALALPHFKAVFDAIAAAGHADKVKGCAGTLNVRHIRSDPLRPLSRHSWGIAIDLNAAANGYNVRPPAKGEAGSVMDLVPLFNRFGFAWGGHFTTGFDGMHFELALRDPSLPPTANDA